MQLSILRFVSFVALAGVFTACNALRPLASPAPASTASTAPESVAPVSTLAEATPLQTAEPSQSAPTGSGNRAAVACSAIVDNIPLVRVESGQPTVAAAYDVTGAQLTTYFMNTFKTGDQSNGSDWWDEPTERVDMCLFDGDFLIMKGGPTGTSPSATRILVVISNGKAVQWASTLNKDAIPAIDPATMSQ